MIRKDIWVEGIADQKFIADILHVWYGLSTNWDEKHKLFECRQHNGPLVVKIRSANGVSPFIEAEAWSKIQSLFKQNEIEGVQNIIIIDADENFNNQKRKVLETVTSEGFNQGHLFLWPQNQAINTKGDLEMLLEHIISDSNKDIFTCWEGYENCLAHIPEKSYTTPARKTKIYAYLEALLGESISEKEKIKERNRNYTDPEHWNLDPGSEYLVNLKNFFDQNLEIEIEEYE